MKLEKTVWPGDIGEPELYAGVVKGIQYAPPNFGFSVGWVSSFWKPYLVVDFYHWRLSVGWLL